MSHHDAHRLDRHAYEDTPVHRLDPRAKVIATLAFIVTVVSYHKYAVAPLVPFVIFPVTMAVWGFVPFGIIIRRMLLAAPFVVFIGIFNPLIDKTILLEFGGVSISGGWISFASILLRGFLCVSAAIVLIATTSMPRIAEALGSMGVPRALVVQIMLLYRYLFVLVSEAGRMSRARALRAGTDKTPVHVAAGMLSTMLLRTVDRSEAVWRAMQVRGFDGQLRTPKKMKWRMEDTLFLIAVAAGCTALRVLPVTNWLGTMGLGG